MGRIQRAWQALTGPELVPVPPKPVLGHPRSKQWPAVRKLHLGERPLCMACGARERLEVHHIHPFNLYPELELVRENLVTLCEGDVCNCHFVFGHSRSWRGWNPFVLEDAKLMRERRATCFFTRVDGL